jgi:SAM-dependent methyltransferase
MTGRSGAVARQRRDRLLARLEQHLVCPSCHAPLERSAERALLNCQACGGAAHRLPHQWVFAAPAAEPLRADWLNRLKEAAKRGLGSWYGQAVRWLSPVCVTGFVPAFLARFDTSEHLVADLGCGTSHYAEQVVCVDSANYPNVHLVCDAHRLPLADESLDGIISVAVLEHTPNPADHVAEMRRVLKPGGRLICFVPFIQGYHASPRDYQRYTFSGMQQLFREFAEVEARVGAGPTSGMLWVVQEWLAIVLSFGSLRLYRLLAPLMWLLSPLKWLDLWLSRHPAAAVIASGFIVEARKPLAADQSAVGGEPPDRQSAPWSAQAA